MDILKYLDGIKISCDKLHGDQEERIGFNSDKFKKNIQFLTKIFPTEKIEISSVYTKNLEDDVLEVKAYSRDNCVQHTTVLRIPTELTDEQIQKIPMPEDLVSLNARVNSVQESNSQNKRKISLQRTSTCGAASNVFSVDVVGDVFPCQVFHFPEIKLGNILSSDINAIFLSEAALKVRDHDANDTDECKSCKIKDVCGAGCKADTYKLHGSMSNFPEFMHPYYEKAALDKLEHITYERLND